jgi:hypothetical protein
MEVPHVAVAARLQPWLDACAELPVGPLSCISHAHAVEMAREDVALIVIQRQLGHTSVDVTSIYRQGIDSAELIDAVHARRTDDPRGRLTTRQRRGAFSQSCTSSMPRVERPDGGRGRLSRPG